jgi:hypothetical protein
LYWDQVGVSGVGHWTTSPAHCGIAFDTRLPVGEPLPALEDLLNCTCDPWVDPVVCGYLQALYPGVPPAVVIEPSGDLYVNGEFVWDCPPYQPVD